MSESEDSMSISGLEELVKLDRSFFNDTATTEIYTLSLLDALPISLHVYLAFVRLLSLLFARF